MLGTLKGILLATVIAVPLGLLHGCNEKTKRDAYWVSKIKASSGRVTAVIRASDIELAAEDKIALEKLDAEQRRRDADLHALRARRDTIPISEACNQCRVPAGRLRTE